MVKAEASAAGSAQAPTITYAEHFPLTINDEGATLRTAEAFRHAFGADKVIDPGPVSGSEDVGVLATAAGVPLVFWFLGGMDPAAFGTWAATGRMPDDIPSNHSPLFAPRIQPTLDAGVHALVTAAREWLASA